MGPRFKRSYHILGPIRGSFAKIHLPRTQLPEFSVKCAATLISAASQDFTLEGIRRGGTRFFFYKMRDWPRDRRTEVPPEDVEIKFWRFVEI